MRPQLRVARVTQQRLPLLRSSGARHAAVGVGVRPALGGALDGLALSRVRCCPSVAAAPLLACRLGHPQLQPWTTLGEGMGHTEGRDGAHRGALGLKKAA